MAAISKTNANIRPLVGSITKPVQAAEAITVGQAVYINSSGKAALADADAAASAQAVGIVTACGAYGKLVCAADDMVDVTFYGPVAGYSGMTPGAQVFSSTTAGAIDDAAPAGASGDYKWIIGFALQAGVIFVNPFTDDSAAQ